MVNAHCADAMVCISNCDKITPGMLMAAMRLNIPVVFVSGGPMEAGKVKFRGNEKRLTLLMQWLLRLMKVIQTKKLKNLNVRHVQPVVHVQVCSLQTQ